MKESDCKKLDTLIGCESFKEFEEKYDGRIQYADGDFKTVKDEIIDIWRIEKFKEIKHFITIVYFDDWYIAIKKRFLTYN